MRCLILDVDGLSHSKGLGLLPYVESLIQSLPDRSRLDLLRYRKMVGANFGPMLNQWMRAGLLGEPIDYRRFEDGDERFVALSRRWDGLSRDDITSLIIGEKFRPCALLTYDTLLATACRALSILPIDLFDVILFSLKSGLLTDAQARAICAPWEADAFRAGRPPDYRGFDAEREFRARNNPWP